MIHSIEKQLKTLADRETAERSKRFFKTGKGQYGENDQFLGIPVPLLRKLVRTNKQATADDAAQLLNSPYHEQRMLALLLLVNIFEQADEIQQYQIFKLYRDNIHFVNNWDLVDSSAAQIVGRHLDGKDKQLLYRLAESSVLWERRISIVSTFHYIKNREFEHTLKISKILLTDREDLIHKAVGWMLREIGNRSSSVEEKFLLEHYKTMPRTMLRYAIEKFPQQRRQQYLKGNI